VNDYIYIFLCVLYCISLYFVAVDETSPIMRRGENISFVPSLPPLPDSSLDRIESPRSSQPSLSAEGLSTSLPLFPASSRLELLDSSQEEEERREEERRRERLLKKKRLLVIPPRRASEIDEEEEEIDLEDNGRSEGEVDDEERGGGGGREESLSTWKK